MIYPQPTKRAVIDIGRKCNVNCSFCYYKHMGDLRKQCFLPIGKIKDMILEAKERGNNYIDFTGGETTILKEMPELIKFALDNGLKSCLITNGLAGKNTTQKIIDAGVDDFLISIHGSEKTHNELTGVKDGRARQKRFIDQLQDNNVSYRVNCVLARYVEVSWAETLEFIQEVKPRIVNFINMNPHGDWAKNPQDTIKVIANLHNVGQLLNKYVPILERQGIGVNIRYFPMCLLTEEIRKNVCNDLHVTFDPYEWDYSICPKNHYEHRRWGIDTSNAIECKTGGCRECKIVNVCGGINNAFNQATGGIYVNPIECFDGDMLDFYWYRRNAINGTLEER